MRRSEKQKGAPVNRRDVLKSAGCFLMLPALESFGQEPEGNDAVSKSSVLYEYRQRHVLRQLPDVDGQGLSELLYIQAAGKLKG